MSANVECSVSWLQNKNKTGIYISINSLLKQCTIIFCCCLLQVFVILWFWLIAVAALSVLGLVLWLFTASSSMNRSFAKKYLTIMGRANRSKCGLMKVFQNSSLYHLITLWYIGFIIINIVEFKIYQNISQKKF